MLQRLELFVKTLPQVVEICWGKSSTPKLFANYEIRVDHLPPEKT
jgi:hypothetical protein